MGVMLRIFGVVLLGLTLSGCGYDGHFRYPCQDPANWDKEMCQKPTCDVTRTCPEHVFKGGRDPRLGAPADQLPQGSPLAQLSQAPQNTGVNCK